MILQFFVAQKTSSRLQFAKFIACLFLVLITTSSPVFAEIETDANGNLVEFTHATTSDGVRIALAIGYPKGFDTKNQTGKWPTIFEMSGYGSAARPAAHQYDEGLYVTVNASLRGTGASGGSELSLVVE